MAAAKAEVVRKSASRKGVRVRVPPSAPHINSAGKGPDSRFITLPRSGSSVRIPSPVWVFLILSVSPMKTPVHGYWIFLDCLGFSRSNPDLSMGYTGSSRKNFSLPPFPCATRRSSTRADGRGHGPKGEMFMNQPFHSEKQYHGPSRTCQEIVRAIPKPSRGPFPSSPLAGRRSG